MATLYETSSRARRFILVILTVVLSLLLLDTSLQFLSRRQTVVPVEVNRFYMSADTKFGVLPKAEIPGLEYSTAAGFVKGIDGVGEFPEFPDIAYVYAVEQPRATTGSLDRSKTTISKLGFDVVSDPNVNPDALTLQTESDTYVARNPEDSKTIEYNNVSKNWNMTTDYVSNPIVDLEVNLGTEELEDYERDFTSAVNDLWFNDLLATDGRRIGFTSPVNQGYFVNFTDGTTRLSQVASGEEAKLINFNSSRFLRITDLKPEDILPEPFDGEVVPEAYDGRVYGNDPRYGQIQLISRGNPGGRGDGYDNLFEIHYNQYTYSNETGAYRVITADEAWDNIQRGEGSLVSLIPSDQENKLGDFTNTEVQLFRAQLDKTQLSLWQRDEWQAVDVSGSNYALENNSPIDLVYPIYVFEGVAELVDGRTANFVFYADAIKRAI